MRPLRMMAEYERSRGLSNCPTSRIAFILNLNEVTLKLYVLDVLKVAGGEKTYVTGPNFQSRQSDDFQLFMWLLIFELSHNSCKSLRKLGGKSRKKRVHLVLHLNWQRTREQSLPILPKREREREERGTIVAEIKLDTRQEEMKSRPLFPPTGC